MKEHQLTIGRRAGGTGAKAFCLPLDLVTQTVAILAMRGVGKTYTAAVCVEEMLEANQPVVVIDPTGAWWGLKSSADGERPGYPVVVFGGDHADLPLEQSTGEVIARVIVERRFGRARRLASWGPFWRPCIG